MKKIVQHQLCDDLSLLAKFYFSFLNILVKQVIFQENSDIRQEKTMNDSCIYGYCDYLLSIKYFNGKICNKQKALIDEGILFTMMN